MKQVHQNGKTNRFLYLLFILVTILIFTGGYFYYKHETVTYRSAAYQKLKTIADLKIKQVEEWRRERLADINMLVNSPFLQEKINSFLVNDNNEKLKKEILNRFELEIKNETDYKNIIITGTDGSVKLAYDPAFSKTDSAAQILIGQAYHTKEIKFGNLYKDNLTGKIFIDIAAPVFNNKKEIETVIIYQISPAVSLYPIIENWPEPSKSAETILITKDKNDVIYLSGLKDNPNSALKVRVPLRQKDNPAVQAVLGKRGFFEGTDYRNIKVLEYIQPITGSTWFMAAKIDSEELLSEVNYRARVITAFAVALFLLTSAVVLYLVHRSRQQFYKELYHEELQLKALKAHFEYVVKFANDIILLEDDELNIVEANERAVQVYQYTINELRNLNIRDLIEPEQRKNIESRLLRIKEEDGLVIESIHQRKDGTTFFAEVSGRTIEIEGKKFHHQIIRDITERKKAEEALRESEERFRTTLYSTGDAVITTDINGQIKNMNRVAEALTGWNEFDAIGKKIREVFSIIDEITNREVENPVEKVLAKGTIIFLANHTILKSKDGREIPIGDSGAPIHNAKGEMTGVVLVFRDQSRERANKKALEESKRHFQTLANISPVGIFRTRPDGYTTYVNPKWCQLSRISEEEALGDGWLRAVHPEDKEKLGEGWKNAAQKHEASLAEYRFLRPDGSVVWVMGQAVPELNSENQIEGYVGTITDITERKKAEEKIIMLAHSLESINECVSITDINNIILFVNNSFIKTYGFDEEELIGKHISIVQPASLDNSEIQQEILDSTRKGEWKGEVINRRKDGSEFPVYLSTSVVKDSSDNPIALIGVAADITERKHVEEELIQAKERMQVLVEGTPHLFFYVQDSKAVLQYISPSVQEITGYTTKEWIGQKEWFVTDSLINKVAKERTYKNLKGEINLDPILVEVKHSDGYPILLEVYEKPILRNNKVVGLQGVAHDITERMRTVEALRESEERFRNLVESINEVFYITNEQGKISYCSPNITAATGYALHEIIGNSYIRLIAPDDRRIVRDHYFEQTAKGLSDMMFEFRVRRKDGKIIWAEQITHIVRDKSGKVIEYRNVARDVTERKLAQEEIMNAKEKAESANKLKDAFIANMSHEIRTPLNGLLGMTNIIKEIFSPQITGEVEEYFAGVENSSQRITRTVDMILNYSRLETGEYPHTPTEIELAAICRNMIREFLTTAKYKSLELSFENKCNGALINADEYSVAQTISNLVDNAVKYTNKGFVKVTLYYSSNNEVLLEVKDTGIGISEEYLENIFEPFRQEKMGYGRAYEGVGLGLSLVRKYLDLNNAAISVKSTKGEGSVFTINFGKSVKSSVKENPSDEKSVMEETKEKKDAAILIVEDDILNQVTIKRFIKDFYKIIIADSSDGAMESLKKNKVDIILMDISINGTKNGLELTKELKSSGEYSHIPVIAVTAHAFEQDRKNAMEAGCDDYISKPFTRQLLLDKIGEFL